MSEKKEVHPAEAAQSPRSNSKPPGAPPGRERSLAGKGDISRIMAGAGGERKQGMAGFDEEFVDIVDYIVRITHTIWEEMGMGRIYDYYQHNITVHTAYGVSYGVEEMVAGSIKVLAAFPDRRLIATDVIWSGNEKDGFHTSHLISNIGHNTGYSVYGPPTGRRVKWRAIANCFARENRISEEWLVRDELAVVQQLGYDPHTVAARFASREQSANALEFPQGEFERTLGQLAPQPLPPPVAGVAPIEDFVRRTLHDTWNRRLLNRVHERYVENYIYYTTANRTIHGRNEYLNWVLSMLAMFPDAKLSVDHVYWMGNEEDGYRVATRWSLVGTHTGPGVYGEPTGRCVRIMGISQHHINGEKFIREWTVFDEIAVLRQLASPTIDDSAPAD